MVWHQIYDPFHNVFASTALAALPVAAFAYGMPADMVGRAVLQFLVSNFIGPGLVDIIAAIVSMVSLVLFLRVWQPRKIWTSPSLKGRETDSGDAKPVTATVRHSRGDLVRAWTPWAILTAFVFVWGLPPVKAFLNGLFAPAFPIESQPVLAKARPSVVSVPEKRASVPRPGMSTIVSSE